MNTILDRTIPPVAGPLVGRPLPAYRKVELANGIPVYFLPFGTVEVAEVQAVFRAGKGHQPAVGIARYTAQMMTEGTASYTNRQLAERLDDFGAWIGSDTDNEFVSFSLSTLSRHLTSILPLMAEVLFQPTFPEVEFLNMQQRHLQKLQVEALKTEYGARRQFGQLLFGPRHPYGMSLGPEELQNISLSALNAYHARYYQPGNLFFTVVGRFDEKKILDELQQLFGHLPIVPANKAPSAAATTPIQDIRGRHHVEKEGMQSTIRLGHTGFERSHPDYYKMEVVNTILGGYFGSRLMKNIREEKGYTYGIYSGWVSMLHGGFFVVQGDVGNEYAEPTIQEVRKEMHLLMNEGVETGELELVKNYMLGRSISQRETPFQMGDILRFSLTEGVSFQEMDGKFDVIQGMQPAEVQELAARYLKPDDMLEVVCGKKSVE